MSGTLERWTSPDDSSAKKRRTMAGKFTDIIKTESTRELKENMFKIVSWHQVTKIYVFGFLILTLRRKV